MLSNPHLHMDVVCIHGFLLAFRQHIGHHLELRSYHSLYGSISVFVFEYQDRTVYHTREWFHIRKIEIDEAKNNLLTGCQDPICHSAQILPTLHSLMVDGLAPTCSKHTESSMGCDELDRQHWISYLRCATALNNSPILQYFFASNGSALSSIITTWCRTFSEWTLFPVRRTSSLSTLLAFIRFVANVTQFIIDTSKISPAIASHRTCLNATAACRWTRSEICERPSVCFRFRQMCRTFGNTVLVSNANIPVLIQ